MTPAAVLSKTLPGARIFGDGEAWREPFREQRHPVTQPRLEL